MVSMRASHCSGFQVVVSKEASRAMKERMKPSENRPCAEAPPRLAWGQMYSPQPLGEFSAPNG